jgi:hypothetical protein
MAETSLALIHSVQHLYFIVAAPAVWLPLGLVILGSGVLPRILGYLALVLAAGYALAGVLTLLDLTVPAAVQIAASVQALWWLAAGTVILRARQAPSTAGLRSGGAVMGGPALCRTIPARPLKRPEPLTFHPEPGPGREPAERTGRSLPFRGQVSHLAAVPLRPGPWPSPGRTLQA